MELRFHTSYPKTRVQAMKIVDTQAIEPNSFVQFFENLLTNPSYLPAMTAIISGVIALGGVYLTQRYTLSQKRLEFKHQENMRKVDQAHTIDKEMIIYPIITWVNNEITLIQYEFAQAFENGNSDTNDINKLHLSNTRKLAMVQSLVKGLRDEELYKIFRQFCDAKRLISMLTKERNPEQIKEAEQILDVAIEHSALINSILLERLKMGISSTFQ